MIPETMDRLEDYKYCWKCYEKAHGFIPDQWNPWVRGKCESCGLSTECFRSPTDWEKKNVYEHLQTDQAGLPAFVAELEDLEHMVDPRTWSVKVAGSENYIVDGNSVASIKCIQTDTALLIAAMHNNIRPLLALVRQLHGERDEAVDKRKELNRIAHELDAKIAEKIGVAELQKIYAEVRENV